jgi:transposase-like protein
MAVQIQDNKIEMIAELLSEEGLSGMGKAMQILINEAMLVERNRHLKAGHYERTEARAGYANGFKPKQLKTRLGALQLSIPQVRDGNFYPSFLEKGLRSERALKVALAEMYVQGVSSRKVTSIIEGLCGFEVSSDEVSRAAQALDTELNAWRNRPLTRYVYLFLDARYEKVRHGGSVVDSAVLIAYGVDEKGFRHILGVSVALSEAEIHWRIFLESLVARGLYGLSCITSDAHSGLKAALKAVFPSVPWQRCQFHLQQNAQAYVPKKSMKSEVAENIRSIFNAHTKDEAKRLTAVVVARYEQSAPKLSQWIEENITEGLTILSFPSGHRRRLRTSNIAERVNKEVRRRTRVATLFPNTASCERLVSAVLMEITEEWETGKIYLTMAEANE